MEAFVSSTVAEGADIGTAILLRAPNGVALVKADVTKWQLRVYDLDELDEVLRARAVYALDAVNPATENTNGAVPGTPLVISDTVRLDGFWPLPAPSVGYNFLHFLRRLGNNVRVGDGMDAYVRPFNPKGGHTYRLEYAFVTTWGEMHARHDATMAPIGATRIV